MGLLSLGTPLDWAESRKHNEHVRASGIAQLINIFKQHAARENDHFYWGDEVEYMLVDVDQRARIARLAIDCDSILDDLNDPDKPEISGKATANNISFHPEYGRFMVEATPARPYDGTEFADYLYVEENMVKRREVAQLELPAHVVPLTLTAYPRMGCGTFTVPPAKPIGPASQSLFLPDEIINRHARFPTLTANIRKRKGHKVAINLPMYPDTHTKLVDDLIPQRDLFASDREPALGAARPGHVYMDSMGFGMGLSCLQVTMQAANIAQARYLYDALAPWTPVLLAVSAAAPVFKGFLVNQDVRWNVISGAVDDRTFAERDVEPYAGYDYYGGLDVAPEVKQHVSALGGGRALNGDRLVNAHGDTGVSTADGKPIQKIAKSRYESIDSYLGDGAYHAKAYFEPRYNDLASPINEKVFDQLSAAGLDQPMAQHFAHLFIRDPLVIFSERVEQNNEVDNDHFENIQLTNWQTLRFKPPALYEDLAAGELASKPGWRVEFRPMEIQLSDFENAAYSVFLALACRAILKYNPDFYMPISKIDENMATAHSVDAATKLRFWFRNPAHWNIDRALFAGYDLSWFDRFTTDGNDLLYNNGVYVNGYGSAKAETEVEVKMSADELINGSDRYPGLIRMIVKFVATELVPASAVNGTQHCTTGCTSDLVTLQNYLRLVSGRASGKIPTIARFLRNFVLEHPAYAKDSKVSEEINYDLVAAAVAITNLDLARGDLLGDYYGPEILQFLRQRQI